jgi:hypothetical protein
MDSGTVFGIFFFGVAMGALLESAIRMVLRQRLEQEFVEKLKNRVPQKTPGNFN